MRHILKPNKNSGAFSCHIKLVKSVSSFYRLLFWGNEPVANFVTNAKTTTIKWAIVVKFVCRFLSNNYFKSNDSLNVQRTCQRTVCCLTIIQLKLSFLNHLSTMAIVGNGARLLLADCPPRFCLEHVTYCNDDSDVNRDHVQRTWLSGEHVRR